ncbi:hypothetical protein [Bailinhaonella thermotolerans]|uniref:Uncharacterized protein n=1 Tax=Bailinhaonella thermotolerans TaxID=1070861 RepID=A0A3A4AT61_9ACTN|nr:hypothetical protein [Bailinhaonella thermotolerans]RJL31779.1 hypothetical protein D5H75_18990 [Bailinhaonella thermotolerans]
MKWLSIFGPLTALAAFAYPHFSPHLFAPAPVALPLLGALALAAGCLALAYVLAEHEPARAAVPRVFLVATAAGLIVAAILPDGETHRWATAVALAAPPIATHLLARRRTPGHQALHALTAASALALTAYLVTHPASPLAPLLGGVHPLIETYLPLTQILLVTAMTLTTLAATAPAQPQTPGVPAHTLPAPARPVIAQSTPRPVIAQSASRPTAPRMS